MKKIGVLTSGGDCAGLNAVIRAVAMRAIRHYGWEVLGIKQGAMGLINRDVVSLDLRQFETNLLRQGGTFLGTTNKGNPFDFPMTDGTRKNRVSEVIEGYRDLGLDGLITIGGDGSLDIMRRIAQEGNIPLIGVPKTIDNDLGCTEMSIGFATAVEVATEALDRLQPTAASHDRIMILEVMGRDAGHIALSAGIAGGADVILIPELSYSLEKIAAFLKESLTWGKNFALVVVAEAVKTEEGDPVCISKGRYGGISHYLADKLSALTGAETRFTVLGHVQRGGQPIAQDRVMASAFGVFSVDLLAKGLRDRMVAWQNRKVTHVPLEDAIKNYQAVDLQGTLMTTARSLGICFGD